jgi:hypothetical protein
MRGLMNAISTALSRVAGSAQIEQVDSRAFDLGRAAAEWGEENPYPYGTARYLSWELGYVQGSKEQLRIW